MNDEARAKIQMLKSSLRCFGFGLLGRGQTLSGLGSFLRRAGDHFLEFHPDHCHLSGDKQSWKFLKNN
jgi:hypothetical protein